MLKGRRVALSSLVPSDCDTLFGWVSDRSTLILSSPYRPVGEAQHRAWFDEIQRRGDVSIFGIRLIDSNEMIGLCQLKSIHPVHRTAELHIRIGPPGRRNQGFGTEAIELALNFAFNDLNLRRVQLHAFATNAAAIHVYQNLGFVVEGTLRQGAFVDGAYVDIVVMGCLAEECTTPGPRP